MGPNYLSLEPNTVNILRF